MSNESELKRNFGLWSSLSLVIGTVIGSGIFFKQGSVLSAAGTTGMGLLAWLCGGLLTLAAGLTIAELGSQITTTGGLYQYIEHLYGKKLGFLSGWMQVIFYGPAIMGAIALYLGLLVVNLFHLPSAYKLPVGIVVIVAIAVLNSLPNQYSARFQVLTTGVKLIPVAAFIVFGLFFGHEDALTLTANAAFTTTGGFGVAVLASLFAYDGWIILANLSGEIRDPQRNLPKAIIIGILVVVLAYLGVTFGVYQSLPSAEIVHLGKNATVAVANQAFGAFGGKLLSVLIAVSLMGTLNGKIAAFPRVLFAMADRGSFPCARLFARLHPKTHTPNAAIWLLIVIGIAMMAVSDPDQLSNIAVFTIFLFYILAFVGVVILRHRGSAPVQRRFSSPLYPLMPVVAIGGSLYVEVSEVMHDTTNVLWSLAIVAAGYPVYYYLQKNRSE